MPIEFRVLERSTHPVASGYPRIYLRYDNWDDFSFKTMFFASYVEGGREIELGNIKIGHVGQEEGRTIDVMPREFSQLPEKWFSLGQDVDFYKKIRETFPPDSMAQILRALSDVVIDADTFKLASEERVFRTSLTRTVSLSVIEGQFRRILAGHDELTDFHFAYHDDGDQKHAPAHLTFKVKAISTPSTNMHVVIGRNGVGKTTLLNNMVGAILKDEGAEAQRGRFAQIDVFDTENPISPSYFSSLISVSFSAFDPFIPPADRPDRSKGTAYFYIGMKKARIGQVADLQPPPKSDAELGNDLVVGIASCLSQTMKRERWLSAIRRLQSDANFAEMGLEELARLSREEAVVLAGRLVKRMSSGHAIVLLTITKLVDYVEEKTLVLMDEPESHLHPPLLSAFMRAVSDLLHQRNGVAIIATHSPVVVQEVPKSCVWKLTRLGNQSRIDRPERESFGENVGILTREIFGLEVTKSGFHEMLERAVSNGLSFDEIMHAYRGQLGYEAKAILMSLINSRDSDGSAQ